MLGQTDPHTTPALHCDSCQEVHSVSNTDYLLEHGMRETPQSEAMREDQVPNSAGGFVWPVDDWTRLRRFLILGSEGGSYYASQRDLTKQNVDVVRKLACEKGLEFVEIVTKISESGRAPKNEPALYALACAFSLGDKETRLAAGKALPRVARIGTHLYKWVAYVETMRGWGRMMRKAVSEWYDKNTEQLALQAIKYRQREGWSHRDLLRLMGDTDELDHVQQDILGFLSGNVGHKKVASEQYGISTLVEPWQPSEVTPDLIQGFLKAQAAKTARETAALVREYNLPREALQTEHLNEVDVWAALIEQKMPMTAMIRNLATMTRIGVLESKEHLALVTDTLGNTEVIRKSRVHPMTILIALRTYALGHGLRGQNTWKPIIRIIDALDEAFYTAFANVEPTGKSHLLALDVSGSMSSSWVAGAPITPREASTALALVTLHAEEDVEIMGFSTQFMPLNFSRRTRLDDACAQTERLPFMGTDCSLPMIWARKENKDFDAFIVYTDSETWAGLMHPAQALQQYRERQHANARLAVVGLVANDFSIADPKDAGMLDVVGMDTTTPQIISDFIAGRI